MKYFLIKKAIRASIIFSIIFSVGQGTASAESMTLVHGTDRTQTSIAASEYVNSKCVVISSADNFADSLSAYNLANKFKAKLILARKSTNLSDYLKNINPEKIYIVGGPNSLSDSVIGKYTGISTRVYGKNRYETNNRTLEEAGYNEVGVADGRNFADALSASGLLSKKNIGLKLVDGSKDYTYNGVVKYTFGGKSSVKKDGGKRISGSNRYETSMQIFKEEGSVDNLILTSGKNFPDAMSAINIAVGRSKSAVVLADKVDKNKLNSFIKVPHKFAVGGSVNKDIINYINKGGSDVATTSRTNVTEVTTRPDPKNNTTVDNPVEEITPKDDNFDSNISDTSVIKTQKEYDELLFHELKYTGINERTLRVSKGVVPNEGLKVLADGLGFNLRQNLQKRPEYDYDTITIRVVVNQSMLTGEKYDKAEYVRNLSRVREIIYESKANRSVSEYERAIKITKYIALRYRYNFSYDPYLQNQRMELMARSPYSVTKYGTAVCEGFTYTLNQAFLQMNIPAWSIAGLIDSNDPDTSHTVSGVYLNFSGYYGIMYLDATGTEGNHQNDMNKYSDN